MKNKTVYISGGSSGIGLAVAKLYASRGANVVIFARNEAKLREAETEIRGSAAKHVTVGAISVDVVSDEDCRTKLSQAVESFGPPYLVVNSAGIGGARAFVDEPFEDFDQRIKVNLYGVRNVIAALLPAMRKAGREAHVVNISSLAGVLGVFGFTSYSASKFGVVGFSEALRCELKPENIWVSVFCPPDVDTPMLHAENKDKPPETIALSEGGGLMSAEDAALALARGVEKKRFLVMPNTQSKLVSLLNRWVPGLREAVVDRIIRKARRGSPPP